MKDPAREGYQKMYGVLDSGVWEVDARPVEGGYIIRQNCLHTFVEHGKLHVEKNSAEAAFAAMQAGSTLCRRHNVRHPRSECCYLCDTQSFLDNDESGESGDGEGDE